MIVDAIVKVRNLDKDKKRIEVYSPKYPMANPLMVLNSMHEGKPVKFVTCWDDIPVKTPITFNGSAIPDDIVCKCHIHRGVCVGCKDDDTIYIMMPERLIA